MSPTQPGRLLSTTLPYSLALLGVVVILLSVLGTLLQRSQTIETSVDAPFRLRTANDRTIEMLQERLVARPSDQSAYLQLGGAYLQRARETGDPSHYARAEDALLRALELEPTSAAAMTAMGAVASGRHRFSEALEWAERSLALAPDSANAYGVLGDALIELGRYEAAIESYQTMVDLKPNLGSYARVSHARRLMGNVDGAIEAMQLAVDAGRPKTETTAWARVQLGNLHFDSGRIDEAAYLYEAALRDFSGHYIALAALGKARAAQGRYDEAVDLYERAVAIIPQPTILAPLGDLYAKTGDSAKAQLQYETVEFIARLAAINQVVYNRDLALFYADHDVKVGEALVLARRELAVRKDIYGYDALAWALYKNDRPDEAAEAITRAMKLGTQDPNLYYHAGVIYHRLGQEELAGRYLEQALAMNPHFSILYEDDARRTLEEITGRTAPTDSQRGTAP